MEVSQGTFAMLPPHPSACQVCAQEHKEELPPPTWMDAMLHCTEEMRSHWIRMLKDAGVPESKIGLGGEGDRP